MTIARHLPTLLQIGSDHAIKSRKGHTVRTRIATAALALSSCLTLASVSAFAAAAALRAWASYATSRHSDSRGELRKSTGSRDTATRLLAEHAFTYFNDSQTLR